MRDAAAGAPQRRAGGTGGTGGTDASGIAFRGRRYRAPKRFFQGTHRAAAPPETLARVRPHFAGIGLTRLANITYLQQIDVPVALAIRPNARSLSNASGKGLTLDAACVSAVMEAIEIYHGEHVRLPVFPYDVLAARHAAVEPAALPQTKHALFAPGWPEDWLLGWDLVHQEEVAVPFSMVSLVGAPRRPPEWRPFLHGSNGLASGNVLLEALSAALLEVIERDAVACHVAAWEGGAPAMPRVRLDSIGSPLVRGLLDRLHDARMVPVLFDCTVDTGVPVYLAYLYDQTQRGAGIARGSGAHLDPEIAMVRALTEAVQGHAVHAAGSRDDLFRRGLLSVQVHDDAAAIQRLEAAAPPVDAPERPSRATPTFEGDVALLVDGLRAAGLDRIVVFDLTHPGFPVSVVRVVVPGLAGYASERNAPGRRALAFRERALAGGWRSEDAPR